MQSELPASGGFPLAIRVVDPSQHRSMPWKNGLGTTTEIAIDPPDAALGGRFRWRLSIAAVQGSGPFSAFPGYERTIMLIDGHGMDLAVGDEAPQRLDRPFEPFVFSGDAPTECRLLAGPIHDFNLMVDRSLLRSQTQVWRLETAARSIDPSSADYIVHCFDGAVDLADPLTDRACRLGAGETALLKQGHGLRLAAPPGGSATLAVIALTPVA